MNALKCLAAAAVVCLVGAGGRADEKEYPKLIVGQWEVTAAEEGVPKGAVIEFTKDGKIMMTGKKDDVEVKREGTFKVEGSKLTVTTQGEGARTTTITITNLTDAEMTVESETGKKVEFKKKKK